MRAVHTRHTVLTVTHRVRLLVIGPASVAAAAVLDVPIVRPGPGQVAILDAPPGADVRLLVGGDAVIAEGDVDLAGSLLFRNVEPGPYTVEIETAGDVTTTDVDRPRVRRTTARRSSTTTRRSTLATAT